MEQAFDVRFELAQIHDAAGAWSFIRGFFEDWSTPLSDSDGCDESEIRRAEERLGIVLPEALRTGYHLWGRRQDIRTIDNLLMPDQLERDDSGMVLIYRWECAGCAEWGARLTGQPDPPVVYRELPDRGEGWKPFLPSVSWAWVELVLSQSLFGSPSGTSDNLSLDDPGSIAALESHFERLAIPDHPMWTSAPCRWFGGRDVILWDHACTWLWARCRTKTALAALHAAVPGDWQSHNQPGPDLSRAGGPCMGYGRLKPRN